MKRLALLGIALGAAQEHNTLTDDEKKAGWVLLFDGSSTDGWRGYKKEKCPEGWRADGGALVCTGAGGGDLVTAEEFENFELALEWKVPRGGNSGIMFRVVEGEGASYMSGPEYQLLDNEAHKVGWDAPNAAGSCYALYPCEKNKAKPAGEWNTAKIVQDGGKVEHWLNGEKVCAYEIGSDDWKKKVAASKFKSWPQFAASAKGRICLQEHGNRVEFRSIKLRKK
jgi:hypothetical protein